MEYLENKIARFTIKHWCGRYPSWAIYKANKINKTSTTT